MGTEWNSGREPRPDAVRVVGIDTYNQTMTGGVAMTLTAKRSDPDHVPCVIVYAIDHVVTGGGNCTAQGKCWYEEVCPTLKGAGVHAVFYDARGNGGVQYAQQSQENIRIATSTTYVSRSTEIR